MHHMRKVFEQKLGKANHEIDKLQKQLTIQKTRQDILSDQSDALSKQSKENTILLDDIAQTLDGPGTQLSVTSMRPTGQM